MPEKTDALQVTMRKTASLQIQKKSQKSKPEWVSISEIETSSPPEFQFRKSIDEKTIDRYTLPLLFIEPLKKIDG